jgi:hypothetical protein
MLELLSQLMSRDINKLILIDLFLRKLILSLQVWTRESKIVEQCLGLMQKMASDSSTKNILPTLSSAKLLMNVSSVS